MPTATLNDTTLHYTEQGPAHATPLLLLHGFPMDSRMWASQLPDLASHARVIAPDFRGFGQSAPTVEPSTCYGVNHPVDRSKSNWCLD